MKIPKLSKEGRANISKAVTASNYKVWEERRGIKIVVSVCPIRKDVHRAVASYRGNEYYAKGISNADALNGLWSVLTKVIHS